MIRQIGQKLRAQIHQFSGELSSGLGRVASRFVEEAVFGLSAGGSVRLTEIGRALEEEIPLHATHKRLSRNLADESLEEEVGRKVLEMGAQRIGEDTLIIVDPSDITKKYAEKMEYLAEIRDGSEKALGSGYWLCEVVGCEVGSNEITPLTQVLWSQEAPDFVSENAEILDLVDRVRRAVGGRGILVYDRGGDRRRLLEPWTKDENCRYLVRQRGDRNLSYKGRSLCGRDLAAICKTPYAETIIKEKNGAEKAYFIHYGFLPVRLPECPERPLWLVVVSGFGEKPLMLLTTEPMRRKRKTVWWAVEAYLTRWRVEDTIRFIKQSYDFEDVRVLTYRRLKNMAALVLAASYFAAVWLGAKTKLEILALHVMNAAKRVFGIPDFRYYALADGISAILGRIGKGPIEAR
ncbi:MAG: transposase, partial [bacterium]|nr:transposase [bacterium]